MKKIFSWGCYSAGLVLFGMVMYGLLIEPNQVGVHHVWIRDKNLTRILGGRVVVQLSDFHTSSIGKREQRVLEILNELHPDIIFLTGDYVSWKENYENAVSFFSRLQAQIGIWAVMGDYDYSRSRKSCIFCHEEGSGKPTKQHSVRFLRNSEVVVRFPEGSLIIAGLDEEGNNPFDTKRASLTKNNKLPTFILSHSPLNFDLIDKDQKVLMLAGDTHGGQIPLPAWVFSVMGYKKNALYSQGLFEKMGNRMFVSRGIGTSHVPIRLFRQPEVVVFHFQK
jgi:predicted MPP superfamily phosphohydrolase